jgi:cytochrome b
MVMQQVKVWDFATRAFHWLLVTLVMLCFFTGEDEGLVFAVHAYAGFMVFMLLVFRLGWGVFGSRHSLFSDFVFSKAEIRNHALSVLRLKPGQHAGHNPLGGLMIFAMLAVLAITAISGFVMVGGNLSWLEDIHEALGSLMQILVAAHIAGVIVEQVLTREKLVQSMLTGFKNLPRELALKERALAPSWRAAVLAAAVIMMAVFVFDQANYSGAVREFAAQDNAGEHRDD